MNVAETRMGQTLLMWAIVGAHPTMTRLLIGRGANGEAVSSNGFRPILFAAEYGDADSAQALIAAGADPHVTAADGSTAFLIALAQGSDAVTRLMLDQGADVNARDRSGGTPLHEAVRHGNIELAKDLVARGADLHARTERGAARGGGGARGTSGLTPFLTAALTGDLDMMQSLVALGADPAAQSLEGAGAVLLATRSRELAAVQMVVELGLDVNLYPTGRPSALHTAVRFGEDEIVEYLAARGADFDATDHQGRTPLEEAEFEAPAHTIELMRTLTAARQERAR